jgi:hypothetical protein
MALVLLAPAIALTVTVQPSLHIVVWILQWITGDFGNLTRDTIAHVLAFAFVALIGFQFRAISNLLRRVTERTDEQIVGKWYVYRYGNKHGTEYWMSAEWEIFRSLTTGTYLIAQSRGQRHITIHGQVICKERDRFNILITGLNHKQQSFVSLQLTIPSNHDPRMLGVGVGDDADYQLSARVYLVSRIPVDEELAKAIIDDGTGTLRASQNKLLQLPITTIGEVFRRHPIPEGAAHSAAASRTFTGRVLDQLLHIAKQIGFLLPFRHANSDGG